MKKYNVVILGATGAVGIEFRKILLERKFPIDKIKFLGLTTVGKEYDFGGRKIVSEAVADGCFKGYDIGLFSAGGDISKKVAKARRRGRVRGGGQQLRVADGPGSSPGGPGSEPGRC